MVGVSTETSVSTVQSFGSVEAVAPRLTCDVLPSPPPVSGSGNGHPLEGDNRDGVPGMDSRVGAVGGTPMARFIRRLSFVHTHLTVVRVTDLNRSVRSVQSADPTPRPPVQ